MSERDAFLAAIRANPDDDLPRLVFADWLDERGDPLGEFIRVQVELEPARNRTDDPRVRELVRREQSLLKQHRDEWLGPMAEVEAHAPQFGPVFVRGLPDRVCVSLDTFLARGRELFATCPTIREVALFDVAGWGRELSRCRYLENVETLEIADWLEPEDWHWLGEPRGVSRVVGISTCRFWLGDPDAGVQQFGWFRGRADWPRRVELVQLYRASAYEPAYRAPEKIAHVIDNSVGRRVARVVRPYQQRFPLCGDMGCGFFAGRLGESGVPALLHLRRDGTYVRITFDKDGLPINRHSDRLHDWRSGRPVMQLLGTELGFEPGLIRVRKFDGGRGISVRLWPDAHIRDYLSDPMYRPRWSERAWRNRGGTVRNWLERGRFVLEWSGQEFHADRTGRIVAA